MPRIIPLIEQKKTLYHSFYKEGQAVLDKHNPCNFHTGPDGRVRCADGPNGCCGGCKHLTPTGCSVESLACKLWLCYTARQANPEAANELRAIKDKARYVHEVPMGYRASFEDNFSR